MGDRGEVHRVLESKHPGIEVTARLRRKEKNVNLKLRKIGFSNVV
jgi:hypothetical protein